MSNLPMHLANKHPGKFPVISEAHIVHTSANKHKHHSFSAENHTVHVHSMWCEGVSMLSGY